MTSAATSPHVFVGPKRDHELDRLVATAGGTVVESAADADTLVMTGGPDALKELDHDGIRWVQLPSAGIEGWFAAGALRDGVTYTSAGGAYAPACAEHCLALMLTLARRLDVFAQASSWAPVDGVTLFGARVAIVGAGGIGKELMRLAAPFGIVVDAVNQSGRPVDGAERTVTADSLLEVIGDADFVVNCAPDTPATKGLIGADELAAMKVSAYLVNVGRGPTIDTAALVHALQHGQIAGAGLDVTDPEPLPDGHPLWGHPRALITPHVATTVGAERRHYTERVRENVKRFAAGDELLGLVDRGAGY
jgi:phosphoglycerate dehydrogenase-like enzyme